MMFLPVCARSCGWILDALTMARARLLEAQCRTDGRTDGTCQLIDVFLPVVCDAIIYCRLITRMPGPTRALSL